MVEARDEIRFGDPVDGLAGTPGQVKAIGLDRMRCRLHHLVIAFPGIGKRWVPEAAIEIANGDLIVLNERWRQIAASQPPAAVGVIAIKPGCRVRDFDGRRLGRLEGMCIGRDSRKLSALIVQRGILSSESRLVPANRLVAIGPDLFMTDIWRDEWRRLPTFQFDRVLTERVSRVLENDDQLRRFVPRAVRVSVEDQTVKLRGYLPIRELGERATTVAHGVPGVLAVEQDVVFDEDLEREVQAALRCDPATAGTQITVRALLGRVELYGHAAEPIGWRTAELASRVTGVAAVHDFIQVEPQAKPEQGDRSLALVA